MAFIEPGCLDHPLINGRYEARLGDGGWCVYDTKLERTVEHPSRVSPITQNEAESEVRRLNRVYAEVRS